MYQLLFLLETQISKLANSLLIEKYSQLYDEIVEKDSSLERYTFDLVLEAEEFASFLLHVSLLNLTLPRTWTRKYPESQQSLERNHLQHYDRPKEIWIALIKLGHSSAWIF